MYLHPTPSIYFGATTSSVPSTDYLNTLFIYCLSNQQHQYSSYFINLHRVWMENMCTSCSCSKHTCNLKALFLHIKGCDNLCLVGTLLSITCPLTEIHLGLFTLRYAIKRSMGRCWEFQLGNGRPVSIKGW